MSISDLASGDGECRAHSEHKHWRCSRYGCCPSTRQGSMPGGLPQPVRQCVFAPHNWSSPLVEVSATCSAESVTCGAMSQQRAGGGTCRICGTRTMPFLPKTAPSAELGAATTASPHASPCGSSSSACDTIDAFVCARISCGQTLHLEVELWMPGLGDCATTVTWLSRIFFGCAQKRRRRDVPGAAACSFRNSTECCQVGLRAPAQRRARRSRPPWRRPRQANCEPGAETGRA